MTQSLPKKKTIQISLQTKILVVFTILFSIAVVIAFLWFYDFATKMALSRIKEDAEQTLLGTLKGINVDEFIDLVKNVPPAASGYPDDPRYWDHVDWLGAVHQIEPRAFLYTWIQDPADSQYVYFVGSNGALEPPPRGGATYMFHYKASDAMLNGLEKTTYRNNFQPYKDQWGNWGLTIYTPIKNSQGVSVGGLGVDFKADYITTVQQGIKRTTLTAFLITYLSLFFLVFLAARSITRPIVSLTRMAVRVGEGDYEQDFTTLLRGHLHDEISTLAANFATMVGKVFLREQDLRRQVDILKVEIDDSKRKVQVDEIVESEFFKELQDRADEMRTRKQLVEQTGGFKRITPEEIEAAKRLKIEDRSVN